MKKITLLLILVFSFSCDDGDFDIPALDFEHENIQYCGELVFFKINVHESLIIELNINSTPNEFFLTEMDEEFYELSQSGAETINYRIFSDEVSSSYFCQQIPPSTPTISSEWLGSSELYITNTIVNDDHDGVEELDLIIDTDNDGTPNYLDNDDDGDGVLTSNEIDANGLPFDTDNDGVFDYLDADDDNDLVLTIDEALTDSDNDPLSIPDYLDSNTSETLVESRDQIDDNYIATYTMEFILNNLLFENEESNTIAFEFYDYGTLVGSYTISD